MNFKRKKENSKLIPGFLRTKRYYYKMKGTLNLFYYDFTRKKFLRKHAEYAKKRCRIEYRFEYTMLNTLILTT